MRVLQHSLMDATAFIYELKEVKGKNKTYLIRKVFGYKDLSNHGNYTYERPGKLTPYIKEKWGKSVIITKKSNTTTVSNILKKNKIQHKTRKIKIID